MRFDKPVLLYGAGREGRSTRAFLAEVAPDTKVFVTSDDGSASIEGAEPIAPDALPAAINAGKFGLIVKSPGVSLYKPVFERARQAGIPISSNLNLWANHFREHCTLIAITGTKGKSTTATLTHLMLKKSGLDVGLAGNVGLAPLDIRNKHKIVVLELSSYQTADMNFAPDYAGFTNLYPEHIDWHGSIDRYFNDKLNLLRQAGNYPIFLGPQAAGHRLINASVSNMDRIFPPLKNEYYEALRTAISTSALKGAHNLENAGLAAQLAMAVGAKIEHVIEGIQAFRPLPHRLDEKRIGNKLFIDDSISTTPVATLAALSAYPDQRIALIAGGYDRQQDWADLLDHLPQGDVVTLVCLPETGKRLAGAARAVAPDIDIIEVDTLELGMEALATKSTDFDTVILSPGAPSYNQYKNFEQRGAAFIGLAITLFTN